MPAPKAAPKKLTGAEARTKAAAARDALMRALHEKALQGDPTALMWVRSAAEVEVDPATGGLKMVRPGTGRGGA